MFRNSKRLFRSTPNLVSGFTLIELMVTITIASLIMAVTLFNYSTFTDKLTLSSAAQEIAITVRQAQTYGLSVKEVTPTGGQFQAGYGVYLDSANDPTHYYLFADLNNNNKYDVGGGCGSGGTECVEALTLRDGVRLSSLCNNDCPPFGNNNVRILQIMFLRPNPDAKIRFFNTVGTFVAADSRGSVTMTSAKGGTIKVTVESTGQVSIQ